MGKGALLMFTEGDVRELLAKAGVPEEVARDVLASVHRSLDKHEPHAHECEGRLCTVCAERRARHNLVRHGGCAD